MSASQKCPGFGARGSATVLLVGILAACCSPAAYGPRGYPPPPRGGGEGSAAAAGGDRASALAPLTANEQAVCTEIATAREFKGTLGQDRYAVLSIVPVYWRAGDRFPRTCKIELFDYPQNLDLQATIELVTGKVISSRRVKDLQPAVGASEIAVARGVAEASAQARESRLGAILRQPLEELQVTAMVRTDGHECRLHRCIEIDYYEKGPAAASSMQAAEPTNVQLPWQPVTEVARVIIDLSKLAVVSLEVR